MPELSDNGAKETEVWLVEDNDVYRRSVRRVVESVGAMRCGGDFPSAELAFEALVAGGRPDVVLLDVQLPGLDGISALRRLKSLAPASRAIILTVFDDADKIFQAVCAGASGYILKAAGIDEIGNAIRQVVEGGAPMTPKVARKVLSAFARMEQRGGGGEDYDLTSRENDILRLLAEGLLKKEIADRLGISVHTASGDLRKIYEKLHVNTNTGAVAKALREGII